MSRRKQSSPKTIKLKDYLPDHLGIESKPNCDSNQQIKRDHLNKDQNLNLIANGKKIKGKTKKVQVTLKKSKQQKIKRKIQKMAETSNKDGTELPITIKQEGTETSECSDIAETKLVIDIPDLSENEKENSTEENEEIKEDLNEANILQEDKNNKQNEDKEQLQCPVCQKIMDSSHLWTIHLRQHNTTDHTCVLCGKVLSSSSSLDRHMLVHSGKRPFKCKHCKMAFTTNGNMHRHMRTHNEVDENSDTPKFPKESKITMKRKLTSNNDIVQNLSVKRLHIEEMNEDQEILYCPVCGKTFLCNYGLQTHMETHPNDPIQCQGCGDISTNYNIYKHHKCRIMQEKKEDSKPKINNTIVPIGFQDLTFVDFSIEKFPLIAKSFCEHNRRRPSSAFHTFECLKCKRAFPCSSALYLHGIMHTETSGTYCLSCDCDFSIPAYFQVHQLNHRSAEHCSIEDKLNYVNSNSTNDQAQSKKEDYMALLELVDNNILSTTLTSKVEEKEDKFENMLYFTHGKTKLSPDVEKDTNEDFAEIHDIIFTASQTSVLPNMQSTPVAVTPIVFPTLPNQIPVCVLPESPQVADSAGPDNTPSKEESHPSSSLKSIDNDNSAALDAKTAVDSDDSSAGNYSCSFCNQSFKNVKGLKRHNKFHTQGNGAFSCHMCSYNSVDKSTLIRHLRTHNGERPFQCAICKYAFTTKANCERHVRKRHRKITKQEIRSAMEYNPNMSEVSSSSTISIPEVCGSADTVCKYCNVDFKFNRVLRHHLRSLNNSCNRKPFFCKICKLGFSTKNNCIRHVLRQHPDMRENLPSVVVANSQSGDSNPDMCHFIDKSPQNSKENVNISTEPLNLTRNIFPVSFENNEIIDDPSENRDEIVTAATTLVNLSQLSPPQEKPLDLAIHALDLSLNPKEKLDRPSRPSSIYNFSASPILDSPVCQYVDLSPLPVAPADKMPSVTSNDLQPLCLVSNVHNTENPSQEGDSYKMTFKLVNERLALRNQRMFTCTYCSAGFTLKSNMERHIKRKHPEFARPTRSRNYIPTLTSPNVQKQSMPTLSTRTRNALREVLSNKSHGLPNCQNKAQDLSQSKSEESDMRQNSVQEDNHQTDIQELTVNESSIIGQLDKSPHDSNSQNNIPLLSKSECESVTDLASVSAVIDTANSQEFKQYLMEIQSGEKSTTPDSSNNDEVCHEEISSENTSLSSDSNKNNKLGKKRSSYAASPNSVTCPFCSRKFPWSSSLHRHILTHTGQKPFKCPRCPINFTTKSNCERHLIRKHGQNGEVIRSVPERPYKCTLCSSSTFSTQGNLRKHYYSKHKKNIGSDKKLGSDAEKSSEDVNEHELDEYEFDFQENENSDTSEKSVTICCQFCDQSFSVIQDLLAHIGEHKEANLIYKCHLCDSFFTKRPDSINHLKIHHISEYNLLLSKGVIMDQDNTNCSIPALVQSDSVNTEDKEQVKVLNYEIQKVVCIVCFSRFWSSNELRRHMRTHTGERPFSCNICQRMFSLKQSMLRHQHKHFLSLATQDSTDEDIPSSEQLLPHLKRSSQNSLLYLMYEKLPNEWKNSEKSTDCVTGGTIQESDNQVSRDQNEDNTDLIQNLLGINDSNILDQMLDSADSAARLLGVKEC